MKAADYKKLADYFKQSLTAVLLEEGIDQETIDQYFPKACPVIFTKTGNRSVAAQMTQTGLELPWFDDEIDPEQIIQTDLNLKLGSRLYGFDNKYITPRNLLIAAMSRFKQGGQTSFTTEELMTSKPEGEKAFILSVQLPCDDLLIWRKIVVPARVSFEKLHRIIQVSFNWQNSHLHQSQIVAADGNVVAESQGMDEYETSEFIDYFSEKKRLSTFLPEYPLIRYLYDFGDDWLHLIELEETIEKYEGILPYCLDGEGDAPPEDVGGEGGYAEFLSIIKSDEETEEKQELLEWAESQHWHKFDIQSINERLKWLGR